MYQKTQLVIQRKCIHNSTFQKIQFISILNIMSSTKNLIQLKETNDDP